RAERHQHRPLSSRHQQIDRAGKQRENCVRPVERRIPFVAGVDAVEARRAKAGGRTPHRRRLLLRCVVRSSGVMVERRGTIYIAPVASYLPSGRMVDPEASTFSVHWEDWDEDTQMGELLEHGGEVAGAEAAI